MPNIVHKTFNTEGYDIREDGTIYSHLSQRVIKGWCDKQGYKRVRMNGNCYQIHRLVASIYVDNPENKEEVNHINGITGDNRSGNLEWVTRSENQQHAFDTKLQIVKKGSKSPNAVLTQEQAEEMRNLYATRSGATIRGLGREFGVSQRTAQRIIKKEGYL